MVQTWLRECCKPTVVTVITDDAEHACLRNSLTFEELLTPFAKISDARIPFRSANRHYTLPSLSLRFVRGKTMGPVDPSYVDRLLGDAASWHESDGDPLASLPELHEGGNRDIGEALRRAALETRPWYIRYRLALSDIVERREHSMLMFPACMVFVVSTCESSGDPMACFESLRHARHLPLPFTRGHYDTSACEPVYILLHDTVEAAAIAEHQGIQPVSSAGLLAKLQTVYPNSFCRVLVINDLPTGCPNLLQPNLWGDVRGGSSEAATQDGGVKGRCLSPGNLQAIGKFVEDLMLKVVVSAMEKRIATLNTTVTNVRKGVKNVLRSWWRKPAGPNEGQGNISTPTSTDGSGGGVWGGESTSISNAQHQAVTPVVYTFDRIESQIRLLADSAFIMSDYETALAMYRMVKEDFKTDKSLLHYASACEGCALSLVLLDTDGSRRREIESNLSAAAEAYERAIGAMGRSPVPYGEVSPVHLCVHFALVQSDLCNGPTGVPALADTQNSLAIAENAADALSRASRTVPTVCLSAAILQEGAALLHLRRAAVRRFAFYSIMAGHVYGAVSSVRGLSLLPHAARCYAGAVSTYEAPDGGWWAISAHVKTMLAQHLRSLGRASAAIQLYAQLLSDPANQKCNLFGTASIAAPISGGAANDDRSVMRRAEQASLLQALQTLCCSDVAAARAAAKAWKTESGNLQSSTCFRHMSIDYSEQAEGNTSDVRSIIQNDLLQLGEVDDAHSGSHEMSSVVFESLPLPRIISSSVEILPEGAAWSGSSVIGEEGAAWIHQLKSELRCELEAEAVVKSGGRPWIDAAVSATNMRKSINSSSDANGRRSSGSGSSNRAGGATSMNTNLSSNGLQWRATREPMVVSVTVENGLDTHLTMHGVHLIVEINLCQAPESLPHVGSEGFQSALSTSTVVGLCAPVSSSALTSCFDGAAAEAAAKAKLKDISSEFAGASSVSAMNFGGASIAQAAAKADVLVESIDVTLEPRETRTLLLRLCPMNKGLVSIKGVRWCLPQCGGITCVQMVTKKGRLLQATQLQRATKARAVSTKLYAAVVGGMPWLECKLEELPAAAMLNGEIVRASLLVTNRGTAPAADFSIKTSSLILACDDDQVRSEWLPLGGAVGASGTVLRPSTPGPLLPGDTIRLPLVCRGGGGGRQTLRLLIRYKRALAVVSSASVVGSHLPDGTLTRFERYSALQQDLVVLPSLRVTPCVLPSSRSVGEYVLVVEVTNHRTPTDDDDQNSADVILSKVHCISRYWEMVPLLSIEGKDKSSTASKLKHVMSSSVNVFPGGKRISTHLDSPCSTSSVASNSSIDDMNDTSLCRSRESVTLHFKLKPRNQNRDEQGKSPPLESSCDVCAVSNSISSSSLCLSVLCLEGAMASMAQAISRELQRNTAQETAQALEGGGPSTIQAIRRQNEAKKALEGLRRQDEERMQRWGKEQVHEHPASLSALCPNGESIVNIVVTWNGVSNSSASSSRSGQHHVRALEIRPQLADRQCPLVLTAKFPTHIDAGTDLPEALVEVCVTNRLAAEGASVNFAFEARGPIKISSLPESQETTNINHHAVRGGGFIWLGVTRKAVTGLLPSESVTIPLKARFLRKGVFDLNRFRVAVDLPAGRVLFIFPMHFYIRVGASSSSTQIAKSETARYARFQKSPPRTLGTNSYREQEDVPRAILPSPSPPPRKPLSPSHNMSMNNSSFNRSLLPSPSPRPADATTPTPWNVTDESSTFVSHTHEAHEQLQVPALKSPPLRTFLEEESGQLIPAVQQEHQTQAERIGEGHPPPFRLSSPTVLERPGDRESSHNTEQRYNQPNASSQANDSHTAIDLFGSTGDAGVDEFWTLSQPSVSSMCTEGDVGVRADGGDAESLYTAGNASLVAGDAINRGGDTSAIASPNVVPDSLFG